MAEASEIKERIVGLGGVGLSGLALSWYSREPVITAWSTPAAAFLVTALASVPGRMRDSCAPSRIVPPRSDS